MQPQSIYMRSNAESDSGSIAGVPTASTSGRSAQGMAAAAVQLTREEEEALAVAHRLLQADDAAELGHGLDHQHAGHDGALGEVARELRLVVGDLCPQQ